jgi:predicted enzyme related to lactoylglutathione lyase
MAGSMVHIEIPADDTGQSMTFWGSLFGWQFQNYAGGPGEYQLARIDDDSGVAITDMEPGKRGTRTYFSVDDIGAGVARVRELGGEASDAMPVPSMGWFSTCTDPHGNEFGIWQTDSSAAMPE